jgi:hypothetical protein
MIDDWVGAGLEHLDVIPKETWNLGNGIIRPGTGVIGHGTLLVASMRTLSTRI